MDGLKVGSEGFLINMEEYFKEIILLCYNKAFVFKAYEIGYINSSVVIPMIIFTILYIS